MAGGVHASLPVSVKFTLLNLDTVLRVTHYWQWYEHCVHTFRQSLNPLLQNQH